MKNLLSVTMVLGMIFIVGTNQAAKAQPCPYPCDATNLKIFRDGEWLPVHKGADHKLYFKDQNVFIPVPNNATLKYGKK